MRKTLIALAGATALAISSTASAAVTVTSSTNLNDPNPADPANVQTNGGITTINFGQNPVATPTFTGSFTFNNDVSNLYTIVLQSSTTGVTFTSAVISGGSCTVATCTLSPFPDSTSLKLANALLTVGTYTFSFTGNNTSASGTLTGNATISAALPEPGTWGMMILGFGAVGMAMRGRRRRTVLAQVA
jgi:hypothetical protein